ncbi:hypothetical protein HUW51_00735 (plasmid) [Adhaeribacter swui]|uniref:Signal transduction histidine kinase dimerisation/phosphoacceptor domain-containing protein n=1 Tax=Adhaeribacter swui TaxID=2086471 RepID=A0A7G7G2D2_9BACT|nr:hypothetical protein [Adhaeribacter swui]QNF31316.1 hypothetical protein HUW51_00735 [Adhaeribacter swui]
MPIAANQVLRVTYEAFSKFSNSLIRCRTFEEVATCFKINLKYLFNYHFFRVSFYRNQQCIHLMVAGQETSVQVQAAADYFYVEKVLLARKMPIYWSEPETFGLPEKFDLPDSEEPKLWGWLFSNNTDQRTTVSLLSGKSRSFTQKEVVILKMVAEALETKLVEICLFQELQAAFHVIQNQNTTINSIMEQQQETIQLRTQEIAQKNEKLLEISVLNAHQVREPLSRILGLIAIVDFCEAEQLKSEIMPMLKTSSNDLDVALQEVINKATIDLITLKA